MKDGMFVFDAHAHVYGPMETIWGYIGQSADTWIERMERNGIDMSQIMSDISLIPEEQKEFNDTIIEAVKKYPDRFIGFSWVSPMLGKRALYEMTRCRDAGLRGVKLYPNGHGYTIDSSIVDPVIHLAEEFNWVVMIHTDFDSKFCNPHLCIRLAKRHTNMNFIFAHMGMNSDLTPFIADYVMDTPNIYLDTSDTPGLPEFVYKAPMQKMPDRILFGSDAPTLSPEVELTKVEVAEEYYGLTKEEKRKILGENAARLFNLDITKYLSNAVE